jgi:hypothetical protein
MINMSHTHVCLFEDRQDCILGVKLLVLSARRHEPQWLFHAFMRNMNQEDLDWLSNQPNVMLRKEVSTPQTGWSVKPSLLKQLLSETGGPVIWCDSDIILASSVSKLIEHLSEEVFVATEEYGWGRSKGSRLRAAGWNLTESRRLTSTINSCLIKVNVCHRPLLDAWDESLMDPTYRQAQAQSWSQRPLHLMGDQDVLTALLSSERFAGIPLFLLKDGRDIAQCFQEDGYTVQDRLRNALMGRTPPLIHAQGGKPWTKGPRAVFQQLSPYNRIAAPYVKREFLQDHWLKADDPGAKVMETLFFNEPNLCGIIPAFQRTLLRVWTNRSTILRLVR